LIGLYGITMGMLLLPKVLALVTVLLTPRRRAAFGGGVPLVASALVEMIGAVLLAPILMLQQSSAVFGTLFGRGVSWKGQRRGDGDETWATAASTYGTMTLLGVIWGLVAYMAAPSLLTWLSPVLAGLLLAVPLAVLSSQPEIGRAAQRRGWFLIPEEIAPPVELRAAAAPLALVNHVRTDSDRPQLHAEAALQGIGADHAPTP
jgi:membrane glycosyltransferase